jgi:hypothetical protein
VQLQPLPLPHHMIGGVAWPAREDPEKLRRQDHHHNGVRQIGWDIRPSALTRRRLGTA